MIQDVISYCVAVLNLYINLPYTELPDKRPRDNCIPSLWGTLVLIKSNATNYLKPFSQM